MRPMLYRLPEPDQGTYLLIWGTLRCDVSSSETSRVKLLCRAHKGVGYADVCMEQGVFWGTFVMLRVLDGASCFVGK